MLRGLATLTEEESKESGGPERAKRHPEWKKENGRRFD
jgi:hypothetical protein